MHFIKSREILAKMAGIRAAEARRVYDAILTSINPILQKFEVRTPKEAIKKLEARLHTEDSVFTEDLKEFTKNLADLLYAEEAADHFSFIASHLNDFGDANRQSYPKEWQFIEMSEQEVESFFCTYKRGTQIARNHVDRQHNLLHQVERAQRSGVMGLSTALRR